MNVKKAFHKTFILSVLGLFLLIGGTSVSSLVYDKEIIPIPNQNLRKPASIKSEHKKFVETISINCQQAKYKSDALQVRLRGLACRGLAIADSEPIQVKNQNTGDSISVFKVGKNSFTTDFIVLNKGENIITLTQANKIYQITIEK